MISSRSFTRRHLPTGLLVSTLLSTCLLPGCGVTTEPKTPADCAGYFRDRVRANRCNSYVEAREALAAGRLDEAERKLRMSRLANEPWAADFQRSLEAARARVMQADAYDVASARGIELKIDDELCPDSHRLGVVVTTADGSRKETFTDARAKAGFIDFSTLDVTASNARFDPKSGRLTTEGTLAAVDEGYSIPARARTPTAPPGQDRWARAGAEATAAMAATAATAAT